MKKMTSVALLSAATALASAPRAVHAAPRADVSDPKALFGQLQAAFEEFKTAHAEQLKGKADAVVDEKVERINNAVTEAQARLDELNRTVAALKLNGGPGAEQPRDPEYSAEFEAYFKRGVETKRLEEVRAAATKTDGEGGYLAPIEWDRTVGSKLKQVSAVRQYASVQQISGAGFSKVFSDRNVGSGWVGETAARPATTTPGLAQVIYPLGELYANPAASQGLIDDAEVDIAAWLADEVSVEFDRQEGIAFLSGDGVNKPHGILTYVTGGAAATRHPYGAIEVQNSGNAALVTSDGIIDLVGKLPSEYAGNAAFYMNRGTTTSLRKLKDGQGNYLWQPSYAAGQPATLNGEPVRELPAMPAIAANAVPVLYGDMAATYLVIDRIGVRVLRDPYTNKPFVHFYTTKRVGGGVINPEAMKALRIAA